VALQFAHGAVQWLAADAATTVYTVGGLPFRPQALRFYWQGLGSATDANSAAAHSRRGVGFAVSPTARQCVATQDQDAAGTQVCTTGHSGAAVAMTVTSTPAADGLLDLDSITAGGFTLIVDDQAPVDITVFWEAWGGDGVTAAAVGDLAEPAGTGPQDYVVAGQFRPAVVMFAGIQGTALDTVARNDSGLCVGFASGDRAAENVVIVGNSDDASTTSDTDRYCQTGECLAMIAVAGGNPSARAKLAQWNAAGFRLNWLARATTNRRSIYLALAGGQWAAGALVIAGNSAGATATVNGLPFTPAGLSLLGVSLAQPAAGTSATEDKMGLGTATGTASRRAMGTWDENGLAAAAEINLTIQYDQALAIPDGAGGLAEALDLDAMATAGFRLIVDTAGGVAGEWVGYLACGGKAPVALNNYLAVRGASGVSVGERIR